MIILDTNVLSALMLKVPDQSVVSWLDSKPAESVWTTSISVFEVRFGLAIMSDGRKKRGLTRAFDAMLDEELVGRVLDFDRPSAEETASLLARRRRTGRTMEVRDAMIAGVALSRKASLATRNSRHFADTGMELIDPWAVT